MRCWAEKLLQRERAWLLSEVGLIPDCDDDVVDEQKWSSGAWLLLREFVRLWHEAEARKSAAAGEEVREEVPLPKLSYVSGAAVSFDAGWGDGDGGCIV